MVTRVAARLPTALAKREDRSLLSHSQSWNPVGVNFLFARSKNSRLGEALLNRWSTLPSTVR